MPLQNRITACDICGNEEQELRFGCGWPHWCIINGIGARAPMDGESVQNVHLEMYVCPDCKVRVAQFIDTLQEKQA